ncbi:sugar ABC transporter ATP-binding protein [Acidiphilium sp.]|uniref:sugar ABC transporter ATP-binding protein n=1 Tax=Acidiphilium sp. TaxID=527 RepID=UPI0025891B25|nr:sugar ABC transporter ATP-binding protein [Acidiphilium sp.]
MTAPLLAMRGICKSFGGTRALDAVDLTVNEGEIVALLGENGAGKSTLIKILAGVYPMDRGEIGFRGAPATPGALPVRFIHQDLGLVDWMTIAENFGLALGFPRRLGLIDRRAAARRAAAALAELGVDLHPETRIRDLARAERALVAIARALAGEGEMLVLDEPTASLPAAEVERLFTALRRLRAKGVGMLYVSHRLDEVFALADQAVVLLDGRLAGSGAVATLDAGALIGMIVGRAVARHRRADAAPGPIRLECRDLSVAGGPPVNLSVRAGEILGLAGLVGAGQERLGRALFGLAPRSAGRLLLDGADAAPDSPQAAMALGIGFVAGDRVGESTAPRLSVAENAFLNAYAHGMKPLSIVPPGRLARRAMALGRAVGLRPNDPALPIEQLSGGNQQKVLLSKWLACGPKILIVDEPTRGVDVGAKAAIHEMLAQAAASGVGVLLISSELEELLGLAHRIVVFRKGEVVDEVEGEASERERIMTAAFGAAGVGADE